MVVNASLICRAKELRVVVHGPSEHLDACIPLQGMIDDPIGVEQFCRRYVEPMGEESDHIHIVAITDALQVTNYTVLACDVV